MIFKSLLTDKDVRILKLVEILYKQGDLLIRDVCVNLNMIRKTLKADIERANMVFSPINIQITKKNKLKLVIPKNYSIGYVYKCLLFESKEFKILEEIFLCETYSVDELAEGMYISSSSLKRAIKQMNVILKKEEIEIKLNPLRIMGNEMKIINFYVHFILEKYPWNQSMFRTNQIKVVENIVSYLANKNNIELNYFIKERLEILLLVQLTRLMNGHVIQKNDPLDSKMDFNIPVSFTIPKKLETAFHIGFSEQLLPQLFRIFLNGKYSFDFKQLTDFSFMNPQVHEIFLKFEFFIHLVEREFQINLPDREKENLLVRLCNTRMLQFGPPFVLYDYISEIVEHFKYIYSEGIQFIVDTIKEIFINETIEQHEMNNYIYVIIPHFEKYLTKMERKILKLSIGIIYDTEIEYTKLIQNEIDYRFKDKFSTTIITDPHDIEQILSQEKQYDVIITNFSELPLLATEILCFPIFPKEKEWSELLDCYTQAKIAKK